MTGKECVLHTFDISLTFQYWTQTFCLSGDTLRFKKGGKSSRSASCSSSGEDNEDDKTTTGAADGVEGETDDLTVTSAADQMTSEQQQLADDVVTSESKNFTEQHQYNGEYQLFIY